MKRTIVFVLTLDCEIDGVPPPDAQLFDEIGGEILAALPGVFCMDGQDDYAVPVNSVEIEVHEVNHGPDHSQSLQRECDALRKLIPFCREYLAAHRDADSSDYNGCEKPGEECAWCAGVNAALNEATTGKAQP